MAERLKTSLLETDKMVDIVCGPDAYRSIPHLISLAIQTSQGVANVMLSADETYADIMPVRLHKGSISASLSIMRFVRKRERKRNGTWNFICVNDLFISIIEDAIICVHFV